MYVMEQKEAIKAEIQRLKEAMPGTPEENFHVSQRINALKQELRALEGRDGTGIVNPDTPDCQGDEGCLMCGA